MISLLGILTNVTWLMSHLEVADLSGVQDTCDEGRLSEEIQCQ